MAVEFSDAILAGVTLVREAIQSQNFVQGESGWQIAADGKAEFSDLTIRSSDGSESNVTIANGAITVSDGAGTVRFKLDSAGYHLYNDSGTIVAEIKADGPNALGGFYTRGFQFPNNIYAYLSGGQVSFGPVGTELYSPGYLQYGYQPVVGTDPGYTVMTLSPGAISAENSDDNGRVQIISEQNRRPQIWVDGGNSLTPADLNVTGSVYGMNVPFYIRKTTTTERTSAFVFEEDPDLRVDLPVGVFEIELVIWYGTTDAARLKTEWHVPIGTDGNKGVFGLGSGELDDDNAGGHYGVHNYSTNVVYGTRNDPGLYCQAVERGILNSTGGTFALAWGAYSDVPDAVRVADGSYLKITQVA